MKLGFKFIMSLFVFVFYYLIFCAIQGMDLGDPWDTMMKWVKQSKTDYIE